MGLEVSHLSHLPHLAREGNCKSCKTEKREQILRNVWGGEDRSFSIVGTEKSLSEREGEVLNTSNQKKEKDGGEMQELQDTTGGIMTVRLRWAVGEYERFEVRGIPK